MKRTFVYTPKAPEPVGPYSQAIKAKGWLYISGQIPVNAATGELVKGPFEQQVRTVLDNIGAILTAGGAGFDTVVKVTVYLADMERFAEMNASYDEYFSESRPARACVEVKRLPKDFPIEIDAVALCDEIS